MTNESNWTIMYSSASCWAIPLCEVWQLEDATNPVESWFYEVAKELGRAEALGITPQMPAQPVADADATDFGWLRLWSANGLSLTLSGVRMLHPVRGRDMKQGMNDGGTVLAKLEGQASARAIGLVFEDLIPCVRSVLRSISFLRSKFEPGRAANDPEMPIVTARDFADYRAFLSGCSSVVFSGPQKKDTMKRRLGNAVRLMAEADRQRTDALKLALSIAAIEALLARKGEESISTTLSEAIAVLLEPRMEYRKHAVEYAKRLYNSRSKTLHGENIDSEKTDADAARTLAAGCLYGVWFRDDFRRRMGEPAETPDQLLQELRDRKWEANQPDGVPELPAIRECWRPPGSAKP